MYEEDIEMAMEFNFDLVDRLTPDKVIEDKLKELVEVTKGYVEGKIEPYSGCIFSYDYTKRTGLANLNLYQNSEETVHVDIQQLYPHSEQLLPDMILYHTQQTSFCIYNSLYLLLLDKPQISFPHYFVPLTCLEYPHVQFLHYFDINSN